MYKNLLIFFITTSLFSCENISGRLGVSKNINDSKNNDIFISEYIPLTIPTTINDSLVIKFGNIWLEKKWRYNNYLKPNSIEGYQMILESDTGSLLGYSVDWTIGTSFNKSWRFCSPNSIMTDFKTLPGDTIIWDIQKGDFLDSISKKVILGKLTLVKKSPLLAHRCWPPNGPYWRIDAAPLAQVRRWRRHAGLAKCGRVSVPLCRRALQ